MRESFSIGGGMLGHNSEAIAKSARSGEIGPAMDALLGDGIPEGWTVRNQQRVVTSREHGLLMDRLYSSNITEIGQAMGLLLEASPNEIRLREKRPRQLEGGTEKVMFGYTIGDLTSMCLSKLA